jgi:hypothetical protein
MIVLSYPSIGVATENLDGVTASFAANSTISDAPLSDLLTFDSIEQRDAELVAVVRLAPDTNPQLPLNLLFRLEGPFGA